MVRILLADDHPLIRAGLRTTLEMEEDFVIVGEGKEGADTLSLCQELLPDVVLLDLRMPGSSPVDIVRKLVRSCTNLKIIILTAFDDVVYIRNLISIGISGYILKDEATETLVRAIRTVMDGDTWFSKQIIDKLALPEVNSENIEFLKTLTDRENDVLGYLAKGFNNRQISEVLSIAEGTVKNHIVNIYLKLEVHSRAEAVAKVWELWASTEQLSET